MKLFALFVAAVSAGKYFNFGYRMVSAILYQTRFCLFSKLKIFE